MWFTCSLTLSDSQFDCSLLSDKMLAKISFAAMLAGWIVTMVRKHSYSFFQTVCWSSDCYEASYTFFENMDRTADPCQDFYQFACGNFENISVIADDGGVVTNASPLKDDILVKGRYLLEAGHAEGDFESYALARKFYRSCVDQEKIEAAGTQPLQNLLKKLGGWPVLHKNQWNSQDFEWHDFIQKSNILGSGIDYMMKHMITPDTKDIPNKVFRLDHPKFGMPREFLVRGFKDPDVQKYFKFMTDVAQLLGASKEAAEAEMKAALFFEIELAAAATGEERRRDPNSLYNPIQAKDFEQNQAYPFKLHEYLTAMFAGVGATNVTIADDEKIIVNDPEYFKKSSKVIARADKATIANYLGWRVAEGSLPFLNQAAIKLKEDYDKSLLGYATSRDPWKHCTKAVGFDEFNELAGIASSMFVRKHFKPEHKKSVETIIAYIRKAFKKMLKKANWMDKATKREAFHKLDQMTQNIGYPDELLDSQQLDELYVGLEFDEADYFQNRLNLVTFAGKISTKKFREPFNPKHWTNFLAVTMANAFYAWYTNTMIITAGILQGVYFNVDLPKYVNFGRIGAVIGHEITHGFDDHGRRYDYEGIPTVYHLKLNLRPYFQANWWTGGRRKLRPSIEKRPNALLTIMEITLLNKLAWI